MGLHRVREAGELEGLESFLTAVLPAAIGAGAAVGSVAISADATKYAARESSKASIYETLAEARTQQAATEADVTKTRIVAGAVGSDLETVAKYGLIAFIAWELLK